MYQDLPLHRADPFGIVGLDRYDSLERLSSLFDYDSFGVQVVEDIVALSLKLRNANCWYLCLHITINGARNLADHLIGHITQPDDRLRSVINSSEESLTSIRSGQTEILSREIYRDNGHDDGGGQDRQDAAYAAENGNHRRPDLRAKRPLLFHDPVTSHRQNGQGPDT